MLFAGVFVVSVYLPPLVHNKVPVQELSSSVAKQANPPHMYTRYGNPPHKPKMSFRHRSDKAMHALRKSGRISESDFRGLKEAWVEAAGALAACSSPPCPQNAAQVAVSGAARRGAVVAASAALSLDRTARPVSSSREQRKRHGARLRVIQSEGLRTEVFQENSGIMADAYDY